MLDRGIFARENLTVANQFPNDAVHRFNGIRCRDRFADRPGKVEQSDDVSPLHTPHFGNRRIFLIPGLSEFFQSLLRFQKSQSVVDLLEVTRHCSAVGRVISEIGETAGVIVQRADEKISKREKFASAHDLRRGCATRLVNLGVSAEALKVIFRHSSFSTTEKHYGASRSAQSAATEILEKLSNAESTAFVGGLMGGTPNIPDLAPSEIAKLKALLTSL